MTARITNIVYDEHPSGDSIAFITIKGTEGDTKAMIEKIRRLEIG